jgi:hypothetical protein
VVRLRIPGRVRCGPGPRLDERLLLSGSMYSRPSRSQITGKRTDRPRVTSRQVPLGVVTIDL